ncbi:EamA family transporter [Candidatus Woesearchaeota archaeon]|nr:EamA family transporter [Candidatus Woesearchaeota archaeon]
MDWFIFALLAAVMTAFSHMLRKKALRKEHAMEFSTVWVMFNFLISLVFIPWVNFSVGYQVLLVIYLASFAASIGIVFMMKAFRHLELSVAAPFMNFGPVFLLFFSVLWLGEQITPLQLVGISSIAIGGYVLGVDHKHKDLLYPLKSITRSKYIPLIFLAIFMFSLSAIAEKVSMSNVDPFTMNFFFWLFATVNLFALLSFFYDGIRGVNHGMKISGIWIFLSSVFAVISSLAYFQALSFAYVALVVPIKRLSTLIDTLIGGRLFHEKNLMAKGIACVIMLAGVYLIIL